jgi:uncharacterized protein (TIGR04376 family)
MGLFDDVSRFLEQRLDEYLRSNPHLELMALGDKLQEQEQATLNQVASLRLKEKSLQDQILQVAQEVQQWHGRVQKAQAAGRQDLASPAQEREAALLKQGNHLWGQMELIKQQIQQAQDLQRQIQQRRKELQVKIEQAKAQASQAQAQQQWQTINDINPGSYRAARQSDPLEKQFQQWEAEQELERLKREMGR